uniref:Uncharacterized protein n=1 Tax=Ixodes ricinus TaxID=34613 RepID=A0A6B0V7M9_IXORI
MRCLHAVFAGCLGGAVARACWCRNRRTSSSRLFFPALILVVLGWLLARGQCIPKKVARVRQLCGRQCRRRPVVVLHRICRGTCWAGCRHLQLRLPFGELLRRLLRGASGLGLPFRVSGGAILDRDRLRGVRARVRAWLKHGLGVERALRNQSLCLLIALCPKVLGPPLAVLFVLHVFLQLLFPKLLVHFIVCRVLGILLGFSHLVYGQRALLEPFLASPGILELALLHFFGEPVPGCLGFDLLFFNAPLLFFLLLHPESFPLCRRYLPGRLDSFVNTSYGFCALRRV